MNTNMLKKHNPGLASLLLGAGLALCGGAARGQVADANQPEIMKKVSFEQRLNEPLPLDLLFTDETGHDVRLGDYFGDKPVLLSLVYYECPMLCTLVLNGIVDGLHGIPFVPGKDMEIVTVSFDPGETPELARGKKTTYIKSYGNEDAAAGWHFLTGKQEAIAKLTETVGFSYAYDEESDEYAHASGIVLATPEGKISRYLFGIEYAPRDLRLSLVEASMNKIGSPVDRLLLFCYHYDAVAGTYSVAIMNIVRLGCIATVVGLAAFMTVMFRRDAQKKKRAKGRHDSQGPREVHA